MSNYILSRAVSLVVNISCVALVMWLLGVGLELAAIYWLLAKVILEEGQEIQEMMEEKDL